MIRKELENIKWYLVDSFFYIFQNNNQLIIKKIKNKKIIIN